MNLLFVADVMGGPGRKVVASILPILRKERKLDFVVLNGENSAGGFGMTYETAQEFFDMGVDVLTTGNHIWDRKDFYPYLDSETNVLRPLNYPPDNPGHGSGVFHTKNNVPVGVLNLQGRVFMKEIDCPFRTVLPEIRKLRESAKIIFLDFHAEASAEKVAMGWYLDGQISAMVGTHTHVQTADERILPAGTGYITDAGMCGSADGVIGVKKELAIKRFISQTPNRFQPADSNLMFNGMFFEIDEESGRTTKIDRIQLPHSYALKSLNK